MGWFIDALGGVDEDGRLQLENDDMVWLSIAMDKMAMDNVVMGVLDGVDDDDVFETEWKLDVKRM